MEKKFYSYEEILLALRDEYLKNQALLEKLEQYIYIACDKVESFEFRSLFKDIVRDQIMHEKEIHFVITERLSIIKEIINKLHCLWYKYYDMQNQIFYKIIEKDNNYYFNESTIRGRFTTIKPQINIINQEEFDKLVREILNSEFMSLTEEYFEKMLGGYKLDISGGSIFLGNYQKSVFYNASYDTIQFRNIDCWIEASEFIKEPIPECYIADSVKQMINKNIKNNQVITIDDYDFSKVTRFNIEENSNGLKLIKIRKK